MIPREVVDTKYELSKVDDRQRLERALHPTASGHKMISKKILAAILDSFRARLNLKQRQKPVSGSFIASILLWIDEGYSLSQYVQNACMRISNVGGPIESAW